MSFFFNTLSSELLEGFVVFDKAWDMVAEGMHMCCHSCFVVPNSHFTKGAKVFNKLLRFFEDFNVKVSIFL